MKLTGVNCFEGKNYYNNKNIICFSADFNDGLTLVYQYCIDSDNLEYIYMISTGLDSVYLKTHKMPTAASMKKRLLFTSEWVTKNRNRYKLLKK